ncbi:uncharacterized protein LOC142239430 [Haematobia irritans]|uniref:uncharacterized protein LOC142239430 n=1 Tax=Haematobia irritans TaxID=7368 RepID=UPI003F50C7B5
MNSRTPSFIVGIFYVIIGLTATLFLLYGIFNDALPKETFVGECWSQQNKLEKIFEFISDQTKNELIGHLSRQMLQLILVILLAVGIKQKNRTLMAPWIYVNIIGLTIVTICKVPASIIEHITEGEWFTYNEINFAMFLFTCWYVIYPIYKSFKCIKKCEQIPTYRGYLMPSTEI